MPTTLTMPSNPAELETNNRNSNSIHQPAESEAVAAATEMLEGDEAGECEGDDGEPSNETDPTDLEDADECGGDEAEEEAEEEAASSVVETCATIAAAAQVAAAIAPSHSKAESNADTLTEIARAEMVCDARESVVNELREELKNAKKEYDGAVIALRKLCRAVQFDSARPLFTSLGVQVPGVAAVDADDVSPPPAADVEGSPDASIPTADPDAWRSASIDDLGLTPTLTENLKEGGRGTMGDLADLLQETAVNAKTKWPKGVGPAKRDLVADALNGWLTANRDRDLFGQVVEPASSAPESEPQSEPQSEADLIQARAADIEATDAPEYASQHQEGDQWWHEGHAAEGKGELIADCPYAAGAKQDDWIRGFLAASADAKPTEAATETAEPATTLDDDLADL